MYMHELSAVPPENPCNHNINKDAMRYDIYYTLT